MISLYPGKNTKDDLDYLPLFILMPIQPLLADKESDGSL